jgi:hypothetical protein
MFITNVLETRNVEYCHKEDRIPLYTAVEEGSVTINATFTYNNSKHRNDVGIRNVAKKCEISFQCLYSDYMTSG